jgi:hypothetical protein
MTEDTKQRPLTILWLRIITLIRWLCQKGKLLDCFWRQFAIHVMHHHTIPTGKTTY